MALHLCAKRTGDERVSSFSSSYWNALQEPVTSSATQSYVLAETYRKSLDFKAACAPEFKDFNQKLDEKQTRNFSSYRDSLGAACSSAGSLSTECWVRSMTLWSDLDPKCSTAFEPDRGTKKPDSNPCFAGERPLYRYLWRDSMEGPVWMDPLLWDFHAAIEKARDGDSIDLRALYDARRKDGNEEEFVALLAWFRSSGASGLGYVDGFGDLYWKRPLDLGGSTEDALTQYHGFRIRRDSAKMQFEWAKMKNVRIFAGADELTEFNRHDLMGGFLSCHWKVDGRAIDGVLVSPLLGVLYELADFRSHVKSGISWIDSFKNFFSDTGRHRRGTAWGLRTCSKTD